MRRLFTDSRGMEWQVFEVQRSAQKHQLIRPEFADGWLCFVNRHGQRVRLGRAEYPREWQSLSREALERLMARGQAASSKTSVESREFYWPGGSDLSADAPG